MRIVGHGLDLTDCRRIDELLSTHGDRFATRVFTLAEIAYCQPRSGRTEHFAARFAAKEAVMKAMSSGWSDQVGFADIEIFHDAQGAPQVRLHGGAARLAASLGITGFRVSLTHLRDLAAASVIALADDLP